MRDSSVTEVTEMSSMDPVREIVDILLFSASEKSELEESAREIKRSYFVILVHAISQS